MSLRIAVMAAAVALVFQAGLVCAHEFKAGAIEIGHPWSRATPGGAAVAAGYLILKNQGDAADRLVSASAEIAGRTEIHEVTMADGVMQMRPLPDGVPVPAHGEAVLKPGGMHLMFLELKRPLKEGESFPGTLNFEHAGSVAVTFKVEKPGAPKPASEQHHAH